MSDEWPRGSMRFELNNPYLPKRTMVSKAGEAPSEFINRCIFKMPWGSEAVRGYLIQESENPKE